MNNRKINILFICTGNAARSQIAAGLANHDFATRVNAFSAGTRPSVLSRLATMVMAEIGIDIKGCTAKHYDIYKEMDFDYVITLCRNADHACKLAAGEARRLHLDFPDTPHTDFASNENIEIYRRVRDAIRETLRQFFEERLR